MPPFRSMAFAGCLFLFGSLLLGAGTRTAPAAAAADPAPARGMFLVADEGIADPRFQQTVILLIQYDRGGGAVGLIVNRPTTILFAEALPQLEGAAERQLYFGGPVAMESLLVLGRSEHPPPRSTQVLEGVFLTGVGEVADRLRQDDRPGEEIRVFFGYSGWASGQLEAEIARGDWRVVPADENKVFEAAPEILWQMLHPQEKPVFI